MFSNKLLLAILLSLVLAVTLVTPEEKQEPKQVFPPHAILNASYKGDDIMVKRILDSGTDRDVRDALGANALHNAMYQSNMIVIELLLNSGFDPNEKCTKNGYTPLHIAVAANNAEAVRLLLQYGADDGIKCNEGFTPLDKAKKEEKRALVKLFMQR
jgi:ankyrin repeat protein